LLFFLDGSFFLFFLSLLAKLMLQIGPITPKQTSNDARTTHDLQIRVAAPEVLRGNPFTCPALLQSS
jgi:hypothetical protein